METADFLEWAADHPRESAWIQQQVISLLTMQRLQACLLTRLLMAAEAADLKAPPIPEDLEALAKRIPFRETAHLSGLNCVTKWENAALGICRERVAYGCQRASRHGHWHPHPRKQPSVIYYRHGQPAVHKTLADLLVASPDVLEAAAKLYPPKGGKDA